MLRPGLYLHVPFCKSKCDYCSFYSVKPDGSMSEYLNAIHQEISLYECIFSEFDTIYIGGGTPSLLSSDDFSALLIHIRNSFTIDPDAEITVEINPGDARPHFLKALQEMGVNRLNIGIQSFDDAPLLFLGRRHTATQAMRAIEQARTAGFNNLGLDLIYGLPGQSIAAWEKTLSQAVSFFPEHLSCYQLTLEPDTPLGQRHQKGEFILPDEDCQADFFMTTAEFLENAGYCHYEISNFARNDGLRSRHNQKYWHHIPYLGLGPSAHSFAGNRRWWNHCSLSRYLIDLGNGEAPLEGTEELSPEQRRLERIFLGIRTCEGLSLDDYRSGIATADDIMGKEDILNQLIQNELIVIRNEFIQPTRKGMAAADRLALIL